jgi:sulfate adenylyltransferase subunit 2
MHEKLSIPTIYFSHDRICFKRDGVIYSQSDFMMLKENEKTEKMRVRYRTVGDMTCTGAVLSPASSLEEIIAEVSASRVTERGSRQDDKRSETAMEDRKKRGYF